MDEVNWLALLKLLEFDTNSVLHIGCGDSTMFRIFHVEIAEPAGR